MIKDLVIKQIRDLTGYSKIIFIFFYYYLKKELKACEGRNVLIIKQV